MFLLEGHGQKHQDLLNLFWHRSCAHNLSCWKISQWSGHYFYIVDGRLLFCLQKYLHRHGAEFCRQCALVDHVNWKRYALNLHTFLTGVMWIFSALTFYRTQMFYYIYFLSYSLVFLYFQVSKAFIILVPSWLWFLSLLCCIIFIEKNEYENTKNGHESSKN